MISSAAIALSTPAGRITEMSAFSRHSSLCAPPQPRRAQAAMSSGLDCGVQLTSARRPAAGDSAAAAGADPPPLDEAHCDAAIDASAQADTSARLFRFERMVGAVLRDVSTGPPRALK